MALAGGRSNPSRRSSSRWILVPLAALAAPLTVWLVVQRWPGTDARPELATAHADARATETLRARRAGGLPRGGGAGAGGAEGIAGPGTTGGGPQALRSGPLSPGFDLARLTQQIHFAFRPEGGVWGAGHSTHEARLVAGALEVTPFHRPGGRDALRGTPVIFGAATVVRGGEVLAAGEGAAAPTADGQLDLVKGSVVEELRNSAGGVEQRWAFGERPAGQGDVEVRVPVTGGAYLDETPGGLHFAAGALGVRYGHGTWVDGLGVRTEVPARWDGEAIVLRVPAAAIEGSAYPAVLDPTISAEVQVDEPVYSGRWGTSPAMAWNGTDYLAVWMDDRGGTGYDIYGARVTGAGTLRDPGGIPICTAGLHQESPSVAWDGTNFLVAWIDKRNGEEIYAARLSPGGAVLEPNGNLLVSSPEGKWNLSVAWAAGTHLAVWQQLEGTEFRVRGQRISSAATAAGATFAISTTDAQRPTVASSGSGFLVAWSDFRDRAVNGGTSDVYGALVTTGGGVGSELAISGAAASQDSVAVTWAGSQWFVVWEDPRNGVNTNIYGARISAAGTVLDPAGLPVVTAAGQQTGPRLASGGGSPYVTWFDTSTGQLKGGFYDLAAPAAIAGTTIVTAMSSGVPVAGSSGYLVLVPDFVVGLFAVPVTAAGVPQPASRLLVSTVANAERGPAVAFDGTSYLVVWGDSRGGGSYVYGARISAAGAALDPTGFSISGAMSGWRPAVAWSAGAGKYLVAWQDPGGSSGARGALVGPGTAVGPPLDIVGGAGVGATGGNVSVASNGSGFLVAAEVRINGVADVYGGRVTAGGVTPDRMNPIRIVDDGGDQNNPSVASDGKDYLVVWEDMRSGDMNVGGKRVVAADGTVLDRGLGILVSNVLGGQGMVNVAYGATEYLVAWMDNRTGYAAEIYAARVKPDGTTYLAEQQGIPVATGGPGFVAFAPAVAWDGAEWIVVWREQATPSSPWVLKGTAISPAGAVLDPDGFEIGPSGMDDLPPGLAAAGVGDFLVARDVEGLAPGLDLPRVFARRVTNAAPSAFPQARSTAEDVPLVVTLAGTDPDGDALAYGIGVAPTHGVLTGTPPALTYTPHANYSGADSFTFRVGDGMAFSGYVTVSITVNAVNDAPVANAQSVTTAEDTPLPITLTGTDVEGTGLTYFIATPPAHGVAVLFDSTVTYTPAPNYSGPDSFTFQVRDSGLPLPVLDSAPATVSITVTPVNDAPVANNQGVTTAEDTNVAITLTASDVDGDSLGFILVSAPTHGQLTGTPPSLTYRPDPSFNGADLFAFKANDGRADSAIATVSITVTPVNDPPVATPGTVSTSEDSPVGFAVAGTDVDGDPLAYTTVSVPLHGTLTLLGPGLYLYAPAANWFGTDTFQFVANDGKGGISSPATVTLVVTAVNDPPGATPQVLSVAEDTSLDLVLSGTDVEGSALTFTIDTFPVHGTVAGQPPAVRYTPAPNYSGPDSFTFHVRDAGTSPLDSAPATITINVAPVNDPPVATARTVTVAEDVAETFTLSGTDVDGDALTVELVSSPAHGTLAQSGASVTYTPVASYNGPDGFTFRVRDPGGLASSPAAVAITVNPVNDPPIAVGQVANATEDTAATLTLEGADVDGDALAFAVVAQPAHGTVTPLGNASATTARFSYVPAANFNGADSFTFKVNDGQRDSPPATVTVNVAAANDPPVAIPDAAITREDEVAVVTLSGADVDGDLLSFAVSTQPLHGTATLVGNKVYYTPVANYSGPDSFTFVADDGKGGVSAPATVLVTVTPVNDAPVATLRSATVGEDSGPNAIVVSGTDVDGDPLTYLLATPPSHGSISVSGATFTYTPAANYYGPDSFTFLVSDGQATSAVPATVSLTVTPANDAPVAIALTLAATEDGSGTATLAGTDVDGDALTFAVAAQPAHGTVTLSGATATYVPAADYFGPDAFTYVASDGNGGTSAPATVTVTVAAVNDAPVALALAVVTAEDTPASITLAGTDLEGSALTYALVSLPGHGTITGSGASLVYTPASNFSGGDVFTYKVNDGSLDSAPVTVTLTVTAVQDAPVATPQAPTVAEDSVLSLSLAGTDPDGDALTYRIVTAPTHGTLGGSPPSLTYTPEPDYHGPDAFTFVANDGTSDSAPATVAITVASVNDTPVAVAKSATVNEGGSVAITLEGSDVDGQALSYAVVASPAHGTLSGTAPNLTYTPAAGFAGADSFTYRANDGTVSSAAVTVSITVTGAGAAAGEGTESVLGCTTGSGRAGGASALLLAGLALWLAPRRRGRRGGTAAALLLALAAPTLARAAPEIPLPPPPPGTARTAPARPATPAAASAATPKGLRVAVLPIKAGLGVEPKMAEIVTDTLVAELSDRGLKTITSKDIEAALGFERQKQMMGCSSDTSCLAEIAGALGADRVVFGDISMVRELTIFSAQVLNPRSGAVEHRFHERMTGGDAQDLLDATERAGAELFPGTKRSGTASRRKSVLTGTDRPLSLVLRGGMDVQDPGGLGVLLAEYRLSRSVRLAAGAAAGGTKAFGAAIRAGWYPLTFSRVSLFASVEGVLLFPGDAVFAVAPGLGIEVALSQRFVLAAEAPLLILASAPKEYRTTYFVPSLAVAYRF